VALPPEPPDEQPPPPPSPVDASGGECPRCGSPYEPFQEYCLECGLRLPATHGLIPMLATAWRRRVPWYPGDWIWPVVAALVIAALAAGIAILATNDNGSAAKTKNAVSGTVSTTSSSNTSSTATETGPEQTSSLPTTTTAAPQPPPPPPATGSGGLTQWPQGQNGWTIVLASIPQSSGRAAATGAAKKASAAGLTEVGVLDSSEFSSLHSGYFVVFTGVYTSEQEAKSALDAAKSSYPQAYVRQIVQ
jgi:cell division septation protein DedD